ncbi:uncharacterized protein TNCT_249971 [Trichonephila clavata]|uniref:Uncharacterized protein n=1 Tax=Trichonephila clavata TaxID=2740835 RepID=A0A8X6F6R2_TRICU|nr:uncharacterized protein TNCT_249971 [Trichonephila clavata]
MHHKKAMKITSISVPMGIILSLHGKEYSRAVEDFFKYYSYYFTATLHLFCIYLLLAGITSAYYVHDFKQGFAYMFINVLSIALHYSMQSQEKNFRILIFFLNSNPNLSRNYINKNYTHLKILVLLNNFILPVILSAVFTYLTRDEDDASEFWTLRYPLEDNRNRAVINFIGSHIYFSVYVTYPCFFAISMLLLIQRCVFFLRQFYKNLKNIDSIALSAKSTKIANEYYRIEEKISLLSNVLSTPLFIILLNSFFNLYGALSISLQQNLSPYYVFEMCCCAFTGIVVIVSLTICNSRIPEWMLKIKGTTGSVIDKYKFYKLTDKRTIDLFERMERKDVIFMSACGMVLFKRSFLLSAFGALFTYGVLLVNLK